MINSDFFDPVFSRLEATAQARGEELTAREIFPILVNIPMMQTYLADFYSADFSSYLRDWLNIFQAEPLTSAGNFKRGEKGQGIYNRFTRNGEMLKFQGARKDDVYPLTYEEMREAEKHYGRSRSLFIALACFQAGISEYYMDQARDLEARKWSVLNNARDFIIEKSQLCAKNASGLSFWHDLYPVMLFALKERSEKLKGADTQMALTHAFKKGTFHSWGHEEDSNGYKILDALCPFSKAIGHLFRTNFIEDTKGVLQVSAESQPGVLILFLANRGRALMDLWPHLRKMPDGTDDPALLYGAEWP